MGIAPNSNYLIKLEPDRTDVGPPEYSLFYYIPKVVVPALQPFHVEAKFHAKHPVDHFVVTDATGWHAVEVKQDLAFAEPLTDEFIVIARGATTPPFGLPGYSSRQPIRPDARQGVWPRLGNGMRKMVRGKLQSWRVMGVSFADVDWLGLVRGS